MPIKNFGLISLIASVQLTLFAQSNEVDAPPMTNCSHKPVPTCVQDQLIGYGFYAKGSALYWKAYSEGLPYAVTGIVTPNPTGSYFRNDLSVKTVPMDFRYGFSLEAGYEIPETEWVISAKWLRYIGRGAQTLTAPLYLTFGAPPNFTPLILQPWIGGFMQVTQLAQGNQKTYLNTYDFLLGKRIPINPNLAIEVKAGGRIARVNQFLHIRYEGLTTPTDSLIELESLKNLFHGPGMTIQSTIDYLLYYGFGLNADVGISLIAGTLSLKWSRETIFPTGISPNVFERQLSHEKSIKGAFDISGGAFWKYAFNRSKWGVKFFGKYDFSYWPSLIKLQNIRALTDGVAVLEMGQGDISFTGYEFGAELFF